MPDENGLAALFRETYALLPRRLERARGASGIRGFRGRVVEEHVALETGDAELERFHSDDRRRRGPRAFFFDYDLDGLADIFAANGHIEEEIGRVQPKVSYREAPLLFRNLGKGKFENVSAQMGAAFNRPIVARGAAYADFDRDGDLDILISTNHGPAYLYRNDGGNRNHWLNVRLSGTKSAL